MFSTAGHKMLQRARSLRRVHHDEQPAHKRQSSSSSDASRASSSGSDSSSSSRENTPEWDPLRLHPSMEVDRSPHITPVYHAHRHDHHHHHHRNQHQHQQHEGGRHPQIVEHQAEYHPPRHTTQQGATLQIYGGFDFGFEKPQPLSPADGDIGRHHRLRAPRSETDLHRRHDAAAMGSGAEWNGLPSPVRRIRPAGYDEADDFIKRGGWKRRGIVFGSSEPAHDAEDNCFDVI